MFDVSKPQDSMPKASYRLARGNVAETPVKFQSDWKSKNLDQAASIASQHVICKMALIC